MEQTVLYTFSHDELQHLLLKHARMLRDSALRFCFACRLLLFLAIPSDITRFFLGWPECFPAHTYPPW